VALEIEIRNNFGGLVACVHGCSSLRAPVSRGLAVVTL
jgi:hypothetical protein